LLPPHLCRARRDLAGDVSAEDRAKKSGGAEKKSRRLGKRRDVAVRIGEATKKEGRGERRKAGQSG